MKLKQFIEFASNLQSEFIEKAEMVGSHEWECPDCQHGGTFGFSRISVTHRGELLLHDDDPYDIWLDDRKLIAAADMNREEIEAENKRRMKVSERYRKAFGDSY
jgi:hypothetical protein